VGKVRPVIVPPSEMTMKQKSTNKYQQTRAKEMNKELAKSIGSAARQARKELKLTQEDVADRILVSVEFYARIERGNSLPSIITFARIVSVLGVSADALLGRQPAHTTAPSEGLWAPEPPVDGPEIRRVVRRLRQASPSTVRLVNLLIKELEQGPSNEQMLGIASGLLAAPIGRQGDDAGGYSDDPNADDNADTDASVQRSKIRVVGE